MKIKTKGLSTARKTAGEVFIILSLILTGQVFLVMASKIRRVSNPKIYRKNLFAEMILCITILLSAFDVFCGFFARGKNLLLKILGWITRIFVFVSSGIILFFSGKILIGSLIRHREHAEYALVLGMALENGKPTKDLMYRVDTAAEYMKLHPVSKLICTGGNPDANGITEAEIMKRLLMKKGVEPDRIILEDQSNSTKQNFRNSAGFINPELPIVLITSSYHMDRAVKLAKKAGFQKVFRLPARSEFFPYATNVFWEVLHNINEYTGIVKDN